MVCELIAKLEALPDRKARVVLMDTDYGFYPPEVSVSDDGALIILSIDEAALEEEKVFELIAKLEALPDRNVRVVLMDTEYGFCPLEVSVADDGVLIILGIDDAALNEEMKIPEKPCR